MVISPWLGHQSRYHVTMNLDRFNMLYISYSISVIGVKAKVFPLHAKKALGGRGGIAPTHS
jgi:hypothetical protein